MSLVKIANRTIGSGHTFIIAEIGSNHNQDIHKAFELMQIAKDSGADAVKFQSIKSDMLTVQNEMSEEKEKLYDRIQLNEEWYLRLFDRAQELGIICFSAPTYIEAVDMLVSCGAQVIKIASPQAYGYPELVKKVALTGLPTILSTGYCSEGDIQRVVSHYEKYGKKEALIILHCISEYPTHAENVNLSYMVHLINKYDVPVGFSDHTEGSWAAIAAVALGASVIEKHITLSKSEEGPDHFFAAEPDEFMEMIKGIRNTEKALGSSNEKALTDFELKFRDSIVMRPVARRKIDRGETISEENIIFRRTEQESISPWNVEKDLFGKRAGNEIKKETAIKKEMVDA